MSVQMLSNNTMKTLTVFLIESFDDNHINSKPKFRAYGEDYPVISQMMVDLRKENQLHMLASILYMGNMKSFSTRYREELKASDNPFAELIRIPDEWYYRASEVHIVQKHKSLACYLYQVDEGLEPAFKEELHKLLHDYGNWLLEDSDEWKMTKWE